MADTKITALAAYTAMHGDDVLCIVDVHDTSMAASGTDKSASIAQLGINGFAAEVAKTANFSAAWGVSYLLTGSSAIAATLPTPVSAAGNSLAIRCDPGYTGLCTLTPTSGLVGGLSSRKILAGETVLLRADGTNVVRAGGLLIPINARMRLVAGSVAASSLVTIPFDTLVYDNTSGLATPTASTAAGTFTAPRDGIYSIKGRIMFNWPAASISNNVQMQIFKNGSSVATPGIVFTSTSGGATNVVFPFGEEMVLAAGDVLLFKGVASGVTGVTFTGDATTDYSTVAITEIIAW